MTETPPVVINPLPTSHLARVVSRLGELLVTIARLNALNRAMAEVRAELAALRATPEWVTPTFEVVTRTVSATFEAVAHAPIIPEGLHLEHADCFGGKSPLEICLQMCERVAFLKRHIEVLTKSRPRLRSYIEEKKFDLAVALPCFWVRVAGIAAYRDALRHGSNLNEAIFVGLAAERTASGLGPRVWESHVTEGQLAVDEELRRLNLNRAFSAFGAGKNEPFTKIPARVAKRTVFPSDRAWRGSVTALSRTISQTPIEVPFGPLEKWIVKSGRPTAAMIRTKQAHRQLVNKPPTLEEYAARHPNNETVTLPRMFTNRCFTCKEYVQNNHDAAGSVSCEEHIAKREKDTKKQAVKAAETLEEHCAAWTKKNNCKLAARGWVGYSPEAFDRAILTSRGTVTKEQVDKLDGKMVRKLSQKRDKETGRKMGVTKARELWNEVTKENTCQQHLLEHRVLN